MRTSEIRAFRDSLARVIEHPSGPIPSKLGSMLARVELFAHRKDSDGKVTRIKGSRGNAMPVRDDSGLWNATNSTNHPDMRQVLEAMLTEADRELIRLGAMGSASDTARCLGIPLWKYAKLNKALNAKLRRTFGSAK